MPEYARIRKPYSTRLKVCAKAIRLALPEDDNAELLLRAANSLHEAIACNANRLVVVQLDHAYAAIVAIKADADAQAGRLCEAASDDALDCLVQLGNMIRHNYPGEIPGRTFKPEGPAT